jgi:hypothetical protein
MARRCHLLTYISTPSLDSYHTVSNIVPIFIRRWEIQANLYVLTRDMSLPGSLSRWWALHELQIFEYEKGTQRVECQLQGGWVISNNQAFMNIPTLEAWWVAGSQISITRHRSHCHLFFSLSHHLLNVLLQIANKLGLLKKNVFSRNRGYVIHGCNGESIQVRE